MKLHHYIVWTVTISVSFLSRHYDATPVLQKDELEEKEEVPPQQLTMRLSDNNCQCGVQMAINGKLFSPWTLYVHLYISPLVTRTCVGTIVASNIILTSHVCGLNQIKQPVFNSSHNNDEVTLEVVNIADLTVTDSANKLEGSIYFEVKQIHANPQYISNYFEKMSTISLADYMAITVNYDFTKRDSLNKPICLPFSGELESNSSIGRNVTYVSTEGHLINHLQIKDGRDCDENGNLKLGRPGTEDILCLTLTHKFVDIEEGQPLYINVKMNPYSPMTYTFLVGVSAIIKRVDDEIHVFFIHINLAIKSLSELIASPRQYTSLCSQPWPWTKTMGVIRRDESLDCECGIPRKGPEGHVPFGKEAIPYEFPWMARLDLHILAGGDYKKGICGGALINDRIILTAAHCVVSHDLLYHVSTGYDVQGPRQNYTAFLRSHNRLNDTREIKLGVKLAIIHPGYVDGERRDRGSEQDLALLILEKPLNLSALGEDKQPLYSPVCLPKWGKPIEVVGKEAIATGWGLPTTVRRDKSLADVLQKVNIKIEPIDVCKDLFKHQMSLHYHTVICGGLDRNKNTNAGDSGGPVAIKDEEGKYTQIAVVSYALSLYNKTNQKLAQATFFADVQELLPWIDYYSDLFQSKYCKK